MKVAIIHTRCWNCGREHNACGSPDEPDRVPENGDVHFCIECGELAIFDSTMPDGIRKPSPSERDEMVKQENIIRMRLVWERARNIS